MRWSTVMAVTGSLFGLTGVSTIRTAARRVIAAAVAGIGSTVLS
jgi:hypothetical protein